MKGAKNEIVIVRRQNDVKNGQIAIVLINSTETTCKQIQRDNDGITLIAFNALVYSPRFYSNKEIKELPVKIIGRVIQSRRDW